MKEAFTFPTAKSIEADRSKLPPAVGLPPGSNGYKPYSNDEVLRLIFLDVDGVLNSHKTQVIHGATPFPLADPDSKGDMVRDAYATDYLAAALVNKLCESTGALIILSSSWRLGYTMNELAKILGEIGINPEYFIGRTEDTKGTGSKASHRGMQIESFIEKAQTDIGRKELLEEGLLDLAFTTVKKLKVNTYVIIDDDSDMLDYQEKDHFVKTTYMEGLTCTLAIEAGKILSDDETFYLNRLGGTPTLGDLH
jgi:hypothetical protein